MVARCDKRLLFLGGAKLRFVVQSFRNSNGRITAYFTLYNIFHYKTSLLLEQLSVLATRKKQGVARITRNSKIFKTIIHAIQEKKGEHIVSLDLRKIHEAVSDFFIVCEAKSTTQVKAIADFVEEEVSRLCDESPYKHEGRQASQWILIDYVNIVVHIMQPETRKFYKLEDMWGDGNSEEHTDK
jgi:ribosome-associated protein